MRLIDADELKGRTTNFDEEGNRIWHKWDIDNAPTVEERPTGEWILHGMIYYCSKCGHECGESGDNFCGNCGAKMKTYKYSVPDLAGGTLSN